MAAKSTKEVIEGGRLKRFFDRRLIKAIGHPLREHLLAVFNDRVASPTEIGREIELEVPSFYKHVQLLEDLGCIERVEMKRRRGAKEHFFRAKGAITLDERAWQRLPASVRSDWMATHLQSIWDDAVAALQNETFAIGGEPHVTWLPGFFDRLGQEEGKVDNEGDDASPFGCTRAIREATRNIRGAGNARNHCIDEIWDSRLRVSRRDAVIDWSGLWRVPSLGPASAR